MYTRTELESMSTDDLKALMKQRNNDAAKANVMQLGIKVTLNSAYGMIGNEYSRYFDTRIAEAITVSGQLSIRWIERKLDEYLNKMLGTTGERFAVAGDTDSLYITLNPVVLKYFPDQSKEKIVKLLDRVCKDKLQPIIDEGYAELAEYMNAFQQKMNMSREVIADRGLWRAKKNYALNVWNNEGVQYDEPKLKIMGLESTRSSTPEICRTAIAATLKVMMLEDEPAVQKVVKTFRDKFYSSPIEDISRNTGVKDIDKWKQRHGFKSGTPYHVKGAMSYNRLLENCNDAGEYRTIKNGDKVKLIYLKKANPTKNNTICYPDILPPEFGLERFVDRNVQYQKTYLDPVQSLMSLVGWSAVKRGNLRKYFGKSSAEPEVIVVPKTWYLEHAESASVFEVDTEEDLQASLDQGCTVIDEETFNDLQEQYG